MRVSILAVGKLKEDYWRQAAADYASRLAPYLELDLYEVADRDCDRKGKARALDEEAADLLKWLAKRAGAGVRIIALTIEGAQRSSSDFAARIETLKTRGTSHLVFIIGSANGLSEEVRDAADEHWSLGLATWPHNLARILLLEQLYRSCRISKGHPYHR